jgi:hypothetical protein
LFLPATWRAKFDLDGYFHSRSKLIEVSEAIEQSEISMEKPQKEDHFNSQKKEQQTAAKEWKYVSFHKAC